MDATFTPLFSTVYSANTKRKALIEIGHPFGWPFFLEFPSPDVGIPQDDDRRDGYHGTHQHQDFPQR